MRALIRILFVIVIVNSLVPLPSTAAETKSPRVAGGVLDLREWNFPKDGMIALDGEWEFYWGRLLSPEQFGDESPMAPESVVRVPDQWSSYTLDGRQLSNQGHATYRLRINLHERDLNQVLAIHMPSVASAYTLWINGERAAENGVVGTSKAEMSPKKYAKVVTFAPRETVVELVVEVSNYVQRKGGMVEKIHFGYEGQISTYREQKIVQAFWIVGGLIFMGMYHFALFLFRRKEKSTLYFAVFCCLIALRTVLVGETFLVDFFPDIPWEMAAKLEYLPNTLSVPVFVRFVYLLYPKAAHRLAPLIAFAASLPLTLLIMVTPASLYTEWLIVIQAADLLTCLYCIYVFIIAAVRKEEGSMLNMAAMAVFTFFVVNEVMFFNRIYWFSTVVNVSFGFYLYLVAQSVILSMKFAKSFSHVEILSDQLTDLNASLEEKVKDRTEALEKMDLSRRRLLSHISHELRTPLTGIQGFVKAMIDGMVPKDETDEYMAGIYERTVLLNHIIEDLFELSKLEAGKAAIRRQPLELLPFMRRLCDRYKLELRESGLSFEFIVLPNERHVQGLMVSIDPLRIEQTLSNLLLNAMKFTPPGGSVTVQLETAEAKEVIVKVTDTGSGIDERDLPYIFERFYQGAATRKERQGAGLGLVIAKEIIEQHGGRIGVESRFGVGSSIYFSLPLWPEEASFRANFTGAEA